MAMTERLERLVRSAVRRPGMTVGIVLALAIGGALAAFVLLKPSAASDTFVSRSSQSFQATDQDHRNFGSDAVVILIKEPLPDLVQSKDLATVTFLEACLAGQYVVPSAQLQSFEPAPPGQHAPYGGYSSPCGALMKDKPVQVVYGPGTFLNRAVAAVNLQTQALLRSSQQAVATAEADAYELALGRHYSPKQAKSLATAAGQLAQQQQTQQLAALYLQSGINGTPRIDDPQFIPQIVFDQTRGVNQPKARFSYLFPTANSALIQVRLKASLSDAQQARAISLIRQAVKMPIFKLTNGGGSYTVSGVPVVTHDLTSQITGSIAILLIAAVIVMALTLLVVFRRRPRLLPLALALAAAGITFGAMALIGATLTMASIAVLPILIGLAVDYAIQFQSRAQEARDELGSQSPASEAVSRAARVGAPAIATAALATATGFLVLLLSPVPMVQGFGLLLVVGIAVALLCALTAGSGALVLRDRDRGPFDSPRPGLGAVAAASRGAIEILQELGRRVRPSRLPRPRRLPRPTGLSRLSPTVGRGPHPRVATAWSRTLAVVTASPGRVLAIGAVLAALGWIADTQTSVQSDVTKLVPSNMPALRDLHQLEQVTGVSGEIDVTVHASDVATPQTVGWMIQYEQKLLQHYGYLETKGCAKSTLCPALSLPDLFSAGASAGQSSSTSLSSSSINSLLQAVPSYFSQAVITPDHHNANLAFGIRLMPLSKQQQVIDYMNSQLHPPAGVSARLAGIPVLAAQANAALSSSARRLLTLLVGLLAVGLVLFAVFRRAERAVVPLVPIALATGWSALILFATRIPLNPMSATLGALVIAISTEFSVLLSERFRQERLAGYELPIALKRTYRSTGAAVLASGVTAIAGFGVLVLSNITMLRDFGFVTLIDLTVSLAGVLVVLPAVLVLAEREDVAERADWLMRRLTRARPRLRRRARVA
ncbi:MAG: MMPL family transporter [Solirubrobacterales bacterium]|nr:MMPL family transporter [Solirubrobacterales bacterium]